MSKGSAIRLINEDGQSTKSQNDRRESKRVLFYRGEFPKATIQFGGKSYEAEVYDLSTNGVGVIPKKEIPGLDTVSQEVMVKFGDTAPRPAILRNISHIKFSGAMRLKLGLSTPKVSQPKDESAEFFSCTDNMPLAYCEDPIAFNRTVLFNITHFSRSGVKLRTKNLNGVFFTGLKIDLNLMMPARGEYRVIAEVVDIKQLADHMELQCMWCNCPLELQNSISEFLLMTVPGLTISGLKDQGFLVADLEKAFIFKSAQTPEEIENILKLRLKAAQSEGRWLDTTDIDLMRDKWDRHARQIYCEVNGRIVAASRIVFNNGLRERSEHVSCGVKIPEWLWDESFVEGSRVCTDPDFRGSDVFLQMVQQMSHIVTQSGHRYLLLNCVDSLVPVYKRMIGVESLNQRFYTEFMQDRALNLLCVDFRAIQLGINGKRETWAVNAPVAKHLIEKGQLKIRWWERPLRHLFTPLHKLHEFLSLKKRYAKAMRSSSK